MVRKIPTGLVRNVAVYGIVAFVILVSAIFSLQRYAGASELLQRELEEDNTLLTKGQSVTDDENNTTQALTDQSVAYKSKWISFAYPKGWVKRASRAHKQVSVASDISLFDSASVPVGAKVEIRESAMQLTNPQEDLERISPYKVSSRSFQTMKGYNAIEICSQNLKVSWCNTYIVLGNRQTIVMKVTPAPEQSSEARFAYQTVLDSFKLMSSEARP